MPCAGGAGGYPKGVPLQGFRFGTVGSGRGTPSRPAPEITPQSANAFLIGTHESSPGGYPPLMSDNEPQQPRPTPTDPDADPSDPRPLPDDGQPERA